MVIIYSVTSLLVTKIIIFGAKIVLSLSSSDQSFTLFLSDAMRFAQNPDRARDQTVASARQAPFGQLLVRERVRA